VKKAVVKRPLWASCDLFGPSFGPHNSSLSHPTSLGYIQSIEVFFVIEERVFRDSSWIDKGVIYWSYVELAVFYPHDVSPTAEYPSGYRAVGAKCPVV
jgi:hypothetical protein